MRKLWFLRSVTLLLAGLYVSVAMAAGSGTRAEYDVYPGTEAILTTENIPGSDGDYIANINNPTVPVFKDGACSNTADPWVIKAPGGHYWLYYICSKSGVGDFLGVAWSDNINGPYTAVSNSMATGYERPSGFNRPGWTGGPGYQEIYLTYGGGLGQNRHITFYFSDPNTINSVARDVTGNWPSNSGWGTVTYDNSNPGTAYVFAGNNWANYGPATLNGVCDNQQNVSDGYWKVFRGYLDGNYDYTSFVDTGITSQLSGASWVVAPGGEASSAVFHGSRDERFGLDWQAEYWDMVGVANLSCIYNRYWLTAQ